METELPKKSSLLAPAGVSFVSGTQFAHAEGARTDKKANTIMTNNRK